LEIGSRAIPAFRLGPAERITGREVQAGSPDRLILSDGPGGLSGRSQGLEVTSDTPVSPRGNVLANGLTVQNLLMNGRLAGLYATIPAAAGLSQHAILLHLAVTPAETELGGKFQHVKAFLLDQDGFVEHDSDGQSRELPATVMSDGRAYVQLHDDPSAPLVMVDADGSYGLATPAQLVVPDDRHGIHGYTREQAEYITASGERAFRVNERVHGFGSGSHELYSMHGRLVSYTEVRGDTARDLSFQQAPGSHWPKFPSSRYTWENPAINLQEAHHFVSDNGLFVKVNRPVDWSIDGQGPLQFQPLSRLEK
jgi:hypothetical protein